ncbi:MAG TPA: hypothetical protein VM925_25090 [Labilithrix sp.]|nr:hypothetical protein [Labilithrix sp.]
MTKPPTGLQERDIPVIIRPLCVLALSLVAVACTSEEDLGNRPDPSESATESWSGSARGTIGGRPFIPTSALAHAGPGYVHGELNVPAVDLIFSSAPDACATTKHDKYRAGETYVQIHDVRAAVGTDTASDAEVFIVNASCASGASLEGKEARTLVSAANVTAAGAVVTFTRIDAERVEGTVSTKSSAADEF